jgi:hypothetical protein
VTGWTFGIGFNSNLPEIAKTTRIVKIKPGFFDLNLLSVNINEVTATVTITKSRTNCSLGERVAACASNNIGKQSNVIMLLMITLIQS